MQTLEEVTKLADQLSTFEQLQLVEHLANRLKQQTLTQKKPQSLRGSWRSKFPEDLDIEKTIREIRDEWKNKLEFET